MIEYPNKVDDADRVYLIGAMCVANEREDAIPEGEIARVGVTEVGLFFNVAQCALTMVEAMHRQSKEDWDGVVWYERLCSAEDGSLADRLVELVADENGNAPDTLQVRTVVLYWLNDSGL